MTLNWDLQADRRGVYEAMNWHAGVFHGWLTKGPISRYLIIDTSSYRIRYAISNRGDVTSNTELDRVRRHLTGESQQPSNAFKARSAFGDPHQEEFAALHRR